MREKDYSTQHVVGVFRNKTKLVVQNCVSV